MVSETWLWVGFLHGLFSVSWTHHQLSKQPSLRGDQTWKQGGEARGGFQQRLGGLRGSAGGQATLGGGWLSWDSGSLCTLVGRWPPALCDITGTGGLFQTLKHHLHLLPGACSLSDQRMALCS